LNPELVITCKEYANILSEHRPHLLLDVREKVQFDICALPNSWNIPVDNLESSVDYLTQRVYVHKTKASIPIYVICRRGWDSQTAVEILQAKGMTNIYGIEGGLVKWNEDVDPSFPVY